MKYYKTSKFTKLIGSTGFVTIIACALIAIGAIGWFALSKNNTVSETPSDNSNQSYNNSDNSYNIQEETPQIETEQPATSVNEEINDMPYSEETPEPEIEKPTYVLPIKGNISKGYSDTALQYSATYNDMRLHTGVDILCESGSNIKSVGSGNVKSVTDDANYGKVITIEYNNNITVKYCGMGSVNVKDGDTVATGDIVGTSGNIPCECADKPHIHIEVFVNGENVSPLEALGLE